ncbi:hypothetical protein CMUST_01230 [Corynebacterium mustelae]|uniref:DUF3168 family protein n=1 Tax=Corynebacterium mustelae TaxID=571915 RepID=A0A0G3GVM9_9CORY|nr:hypothetical protein [Corynebacterium mustelae]AKK04595.1 hypothetical protein CMUST_01230 [Corynebacterium mustelae]
MNIPGTLKFPDVENLLCDYFDTETATWDPQPKTCTYIPDDYPNEIANNPLIVIQRVGGPADPTMDYPLVEIGVLASTRADAWNMLLHIRQSLTGLRATKDLGNFRVADIEEKGGPRMSAWANPDHRWVSTIYELGIRLHR